MMSVDTFKKVVDDAHCIRDLIVKHEKNLGNEAEKLKDWQVQLEEEERIVSNTGTVKTRESQKQAMEELLDEPKLEDFANTLRSNNFHSDAKVLWEKIYERRTAKLGADNFKTLDAYHSLGRCLYKLKEYDTAMDAFREVYERWNLTLGQDHQNTLAAQANIAYCLQYQKKYSEAFPLLNVVYEKEVEILGLEHMNTKNTKSSLDAVRKVLGY